MANCPDCDASVPPRLGMYVGQVVDCPDCGIALEVISLNPFVVDYYSTEEGWDEEEE